MGRFDEIYMLKALLKGEKAIDLSIQKWEYGIEHHEWNMLGKGATCALCASVHGRRCILCPLNIFDSAKQCDTSGSPFTDYKRNCIDYPLSKEDEEINKRYANIMLTTLKDVKDWMIDNNIY